MNSIGERAVSQQEMTALVDAICEQTAATCEQKCGRALRALVLSGSLARGEGTIVCEGEQHRLLGDAEFFLVTADAVTLPARFDARRLSQEVESSLSRRGILCHVEISPVDLKYLRTLPRRILSYELKKCGRVVSGEPDILSLVPEFEPAEILLEDAWRLLANRIVEQLDATDSLTPGLRELPEGLYYRTLKLYLDMATSLLVFLGAYQPSYRERARVLSRLAVGRASWDGLLPFPLGAFSEIVQVCTELKLRGFAPNHEPPGVQARASVEFWEQAVGYARRLWRWELQRLTGTCDNLGNLMERWARLQPMAKRLRGWAYVARACGWIRGCHHWPRWMVLCTRTSPRCLVYAAAADLLFDLSAWVKSGQSHWPDGTEGKRMGPLPVKENRDRSPDWRELAAEIAMNYHRFVKGTCA